MRPSLEHCFKLLLLLALGGVTMHVPDADVSGVRVVTKRQPRQYMNRRGGFNRPLPPERNR